MPDHECRKFFADLGAYLDDELAPPLRQGVDHHLIGCPGCRRLVRTCQQTILVYRRQPAPELPAALHQHLMSRLQRNLET